MPNLSYSENYYQSIRSDSEASAEQVVPLILRLLSSQSVVDVGCGCGTWTKAYKQAGVKEVLGIDGNDVKLDQLVIDPAEFQRRDLTQPLRLDRRFDQVNCLEVAEHLPQERAKSFVEDLCRLGDLVVFSAAVPGQGGTHHINEQWPAFWIAHFQENNYVAVDCIRPQIWENPRVAWWYVQNLFVFIKQSKIQNYPAAVEISRQPFPTNVVHPRAYVKATVPQEMSPRMLKEVAKALPYFPQKILDHLKK
jgi:SAM-dependent methyltransferase